MKEASLASIVVQHPSTAIVMEKYGLDFCCKGKRSLEVACAEKDLPLDAVVAELNSATRNTNACSITMPPTAMTLEQLINHIVIKHHFYVKQSMPVIHAHLERVATKHGDRFPYMKEVFKLFCELEEEMLNHMQKEELILFVRIKHLESKADPKSTFQAIHGPVTVMQDEHDHAGYLTEQIKSLTNNYTPPADACTTFRLSLAELKAFEEDLHTHVHLENNILFPAAEKLALSLS